MTPPPIVTASGLDPLLLWPALALLGALLAMDENSLAQTWFSQPLPACLLAGVLAADPAAGLAVGLVIQLAISGNLPVGASFRLDTVSASVGVTAGAILCGWQAPSWQQIAGAQANEAVERLGWLMTLVTAASLLGGRLVLFERLACLRRMLAGYRSVRDGDLKRLESLHGRCLLATGLRGAFLVVVWALATQSLWNLGPASLPPLARESLGLLPLLAPLLAAGSLLERYRPRRTLPWVAAGLVVGFVAVRFMT